MLKSIVKDISTVLIFISVIACYSMLSGCSPQQKLQRLENKDPELFTPITKDSVHATIKYVKIDTDIIIPKQADTASFIFKPAVITDTVIKFKHGSIKIVIKHDTIEGICNTDSLNELVAYQKEVIDSDRTVIKQGLVQDKIHVVSWYDIVSYILAVCFLALVLFLIFYPKLEEASKK